MTKQIQINCDVSDCPSFAVSNVSFIDNLPDGWESRAEDLHVCPKHVEITSDDLLETKNEY